MMSCQPLSACVGEFDGDNLPGVLYLATTYGAGFVNVTVEAESFSTQAQFQNGAQSGIAARLDNAREGSYDALSNLYAPIDVLSGEDLTSAFENLVPHEHYQLRRASEAHLELFANQMRDVALGQGRAEASGQAMAAGFTADPHKMDEFTEKVLRFWRGKREKLPNFRAAARIAFALKPNSASCERVFSLLKQFFGEQEDDSLADLIQAILMLNYNNRSPG